MAKFKVAAQATFKHSIMIPVPGKEDDELPMVFNHLTVKQLQNAEETMRIAMQGAAVMEDEDEKAKAEMAAMIQFVRTVAKGWETEDKMPFNDKNIALAITNYPSFMGALTVGYTREMWCLREKR